MNRDSSELRQRHDQVMGNHAPMFYDQPLQLLRGDGVWLEDADGNRFLDLYNNVPCVGHGNRHVADAIARQASTLNVHSRYLHQTTVEYAERLVGLHHDGIESVIITCSGSEAVELAMRMARDSTGRRGLICTDATYHGNTSLVGKTRRLPVGTDLDGVKSISTPQTFRPAAEDMSDAELLQHHLDQLADTINSFEEEGGFAGILLCSILANEGLVNPPQGWFDAAISMVREAGGVVIADEVQAGFGRSGDWWGYETVGFTPDIVCMGKPMGNGVPIAAVASSHERISHFRRENRYFNTFAASPFQAAAGDAVIDEIENRELLSSVSAIGERLRSELRALQDSYPVMGDVRGTGMFIGVDWVKPGTNDYDVDGAAAFVEAMKTRGMLLSRAGEHFNVIKVRPPLVFESKHGDLFLEAFVDALGAPTN